MVDSLNVPQNLTDVVDIQVIDKSDTLRRFLTDLLLRVETLEETVISLQTQIDELP